MSEDAALDAAAEAVYRVILTSIWAGVDPVVAALHDAAWADLEDERRTHYRAVASAAVGAWLGDPSTPVGGRTESGG